MRQRQIKTELLRDEWFLTLTPDEKWFFTYFLISPDISTVGIGQIPEKIISLDTGFETETINQLKKRMQESGKLFFIDNWVCIANFHKHNSMTKSPKVIIGGSNQIEGLPTKVYEFFNKKLKERNTVNLDDYLEVKRRNKIKKQLRKTKPGLMGARLDIEVDRVMGIVDSGKMDWAELVSDSKGTSDYPTPESVRYDDFIEAGTKYKVRPYVLYWFFIKKSTSLKASGRKKANYKAVLFELAPSCIGKRLDRDTKFVAATMFAKDLRGVILTRPQVEEMIIKGNI